MTRQLWVVDVETTGLGPAAVPLEIGAVCVATGEEFRAVPHVTQSQMAQAEPIALGINRYYERGVFKDMLESPTANQHIYDWLKNMLLGNTLGGSNPTFDAAILAKGVTSDGPLGTPWHHRLWDISAYAAGVLGLDELPGLAKVCELLDVVNDEPHSALGDARATAECFRRLKFMTGMTDKTRQDLLGEFAEQNRAR